MSRQAILRHDPPPKSPVVSGTATSNGEVPRQLGSFHLVTEPIDVSDSYGQKGMKIVKWQSETTGLSVVWLDHESPLVNGYFTGERAWRHARMLEA
jgi:hypothetical protein